MKNITTCLVAVLAAAWAFADEDPATREHQFYRTYGPSPLFKDNSFVGEAVEDKALPDAEAWKTRVPRAVWDGHPREVATFSDAWRMVGEKLHKPEKGTNFKRNYVYTPFGKSVFVWGSCFITMFGQYASNVFPFIEQLDNFYAAQDSDGFIPRQLGIYDGRSQFERSDLSSIGGNIFAWAELEWFRYSGDKSRLRRVYPVLLAYHEWIRRNRTWKDGTYMSSGWGCGMDNIPRFDTKRYSAEFHHGFISWVDVTFQQVFNAKCLLAIAAEAGLPRNADLEAEIVALTRIANERMWDEETGLYHDLDRDGSRAKARHIGAFWALLAGIAPPDRARRLAAALENPATFAAPCGTRSLAKDNFGYEPDGGNYWRGGVWCIIDWMVVRGLDACGLSDVAHRLACRHVSAIASVHADTGTIWESYDPERLAPGKLYGQPVRREFVGFSGVTPIAMLVRDVFGMDFTPGKVVWKVRLLERHGIENLTLPDGNVVSLVCEQRKSADEKPVVRVTSTRPLEVVLETCADASQAADDARNLAAILRDMRKDVAGLNLNVGYPGKFLEVPDDVTAKRVQKFVTRVVDLRRDGELYDVGEESTGYVEAECTAKPTLYFGESKAEAMNENPAFFEQTNLVVEVKSGVWRTPLPLALRYFRFKGEQPKVVRFIEEIADVKERVTFSGTEREMAMHKAALRTLRLCMREFLIDGVKRDRLPWAGDLTVSLLANAASYRDAEIVKRTLVVLDSAGWKAGDINGIIDYSLWHVISHDMFQENFSDLDFLREQYPNIAGRLESFVGRVSESGLIDGAALKRNPTWLFIDWTGSKLESTTALNMIYYGALQAGARLADRLGENADAERWRERAHSVKAALMAKAWDSERGLFRFSVDEDGAKPGHFTRHGNIYAVIFGVAGDSELKSIGAALAGEELPPVGTPYVAAYEAMALIRCGRKADARRLIEKVWGGMLDAGATSFWEGFDANEKGDEMLRFYGRPYGKSLCHAWSSAPVFLLPMLKEP